MKKIIVLFALGIFIFSACTSIKSVSTGLENEAFLEFIGTPSHYLGGVYVNVDDNITFVAQVKKDGAKYAKGTVYAIPTGRHSVTVSYENKVIFKKEIFVSTQETKKIILF